MWMAVRHQVIIGIGLHMDDSQVGETWRTGLPGLSGKEMALQDGYAME